jgi:hypothetical protein
MVIRKCEGCGSTVRREVTGVAVVCDEKGKPLGGATEVADAVMGAPVKAKGKAKAKAAPVVTQGDVVGVKPDRNAYIVKSWKDGAKVSALASECGISAGRVAHIVGSALMVEYRKAQAALTKEPGRGKKAKSKGAVETGGAGGA